MRSRPESELSELSDVDEDVAEPVDKVKPANTAAPAKSSGVDQAAKDAKKMAKVLQDLEAASAAKMKAAREAKAMAEITARAEAAAAKAASSTKKAATKKVPTKKTPKQAVAEEKDMAAAEGGVAAKEAGNEPEGNLGRGKRSKRGVTRA